MGCVNPTRQRKRGYVDHNQTGTNGHPTVQQYASPTERITILSAIVGCGKYFSSESAGRGSVITNCVFEEERSANEKGKG